MARVPTPPRAAAALAIALALAACGRGDLDSPVPERRAAAVRRLAGRGDAADLPVLLVAQRDPSPLVRRAAAEAFARRGGASGADALGPLLLDPDPAVACAAAAGLGAMASEPRASQQLVGAYGQASPAGRAAISAALARVGTSLREAVELEARRLWERNLSALEAGKGRARAGAAEELGASGRAEAVARLLPLVDPNRDRDPTLLAAAARGLGEAGDGQARPHLEALLAEPDAAVAEAAAEALGALGDPAAADALAEASATGSGRLAAAGVEALAALPQAPEVGIALCQVAGRTPDPGAASRAARQVRLREAECPEKIFVTRLGHGQDAAVLSALAELGYGGDAARAAAERVLAALDGGRLDADARPLAAIALGRLGWAGAAPALTKRAQALLQRVSDARARWIPGRLPARGAIALGGAPDARVAAVVARPAVDPAAGGARDAPPPVPEWMDRVSPADAEELGATVAALGRLRADGAVAIATPLVRDPAEAIRAGAIEALGAAAGPASLPALAAALRDPSLRVRTAAARALAPLGARAVAPLAEAVAASRPDEPEWRAALADALGVTGAPDAVAPLAALLDGAAAADAAAALAHLGAAAGARPLADLLGRPDAPARAEAIDAIAQLAAADCAPAIAAQLTSDRPEVRAAAARAVGLLRYEPAAATVEALRSDYYGRVRRAAVEALSRLPSGAPRARP